MVNLRVKQSEIRDSWVLVKHVFDTFDFVMFKLICGHFGALCYFSGKYDFYNAASSTFILFQLNFYIRSLRQ